MTQNNYLISEVINDLYNYGKASIQVDNKDVTDKDWLIHFKVSDLGDLDIYRESIIYTDDSKSKIEDKYFWNVDREEIPYYISYLLSASLTGGLKILDNQDVEKTQKFNSIIEKMATLIIPKLNISNKEIAEVFTVNDLTLIDIFNNKDVSNVFIPCLENKDALINYVNLLLNNLEDRLNYIRKVCIEFTSGNSRQLNKWLKITSDENTTVYKK